MAEQTVVRTAPERAATPSPAPRRRPPAPLVALLAVSLLLGVLWAALTPLFQSPDEQSHFGAVQALGERFALSGDPERPSFSTESDAATAGVNANQVAGQLPIKPEWSEDVEARWRRTDADTRPDDGGGPNTAATNPPAFYLWGAIGYAAASPAGFLDRLLAVRLFAVLWLPLTVLGTWLLAGEVFGRRRILQASAAAVPALLPMVAFVSASVNPDGMLYALSTLALWLGVRALKRGLTVRTGAALFAVIGLACCVKATAYFLLPGAVAVLAMDLWRRRPLRLPDVVRTLLVAVVPLALTLGVWIAISRSLGRAAAVQVAGAASAGGGTNLREFASYVWQYYLPRAPFLQEYPIPPGGYPALRTWITQGWGAFGWLEIKFAPPVYKVLGAVTAAVLAGAAVALVRLRRRVDLRVAAFLAISVVALVGGLHWTDYHQLEAGALGFMQGRYAFPLIGLAGLALAGALRNLPPRPRALAAGAAIGGLAVYHLLSLGLVVERFYA